MDSLLPSATVVDATPIGLRANLSPTFDFRRFWSGFYANNLLINLLRSVTVSAGEQAGQHSLNLFDITAVVVTTLAPKVPVAINRVSSSHELQLLLVLVLALELLLVLELLL